MSDLTRMRFVRGLAAGCGLLAAQLVAASDVYEASPDFQNPWMLPPVATNLAPAVGGLVFNGHAHEYRLPGTGATPVVPSTPNGAVKLPHSAFGQTMAGLRPDFLLGEVIAPPPGVDTNREPALISPAFMAFWVPSKLQLVAADHGPVRIDWRMLDGSTSTRLYLVSAVPVRRPARMFWTESPWNAPAVNLRDKFVTIHYNAQVPAPLPADFDVGTEQNSAPTNATIWLDKQNMLRAKGCGGLVLIEYFETGSKTRQIGIEIIEPLEPRVNTIPVDIGSRLLPISSVYAGEELTAQVTKGLPSLAYHHSAPSGRGHFHNWLFAISRTVDAPWELEVYWKHLGLLGVEWPFEVDWYAADWPEDRDCQIYARGDATTNAPVTIPEGLTAQLEGCQDPPRHASLSGDGKSFSSAGPGHALLRYNAGDDVWFQVVRSVDHTNNLVFDRAPIPWMIGEEIRPVKQEPVASLGGDGSFFSLPATPSVETLEVWARPMTNQNMILFKLSGANPNDHWLDYMDISVNSIGFWEFYAYDGAAHSATSAVRVVPGQMYHLAVVCDRHAGTASWFVNGVQQGQALSLNFNTWPGTDQSFLFGSPDSTHHGKEYRGFWGDLSELRLWGRPLGVEGIQANMGRALRGTELGLLHLLDFKDRELSGRAVLFLDRARGGWVALNGVLGVPYPPPLKLSHKLSFDGSSSLFQVLSTPTTLTIEAWLRAGRSNVTMYVQRALTGSTNDPRRELFLDANGRFNYYAKTSTAQTIVGTTAIEDGQWYHVAVVRDNAGMARLYVNGAQEGAAINDTVVSGEDAWVYEFGRGASAEGRGFFAGEMAMVRMWGLAFTGEDVRNTMYRAVEATEAGLLHLVTFDDLYVDAPGGPQLRDHVRDQRLPWLGATVPSGLPTDRLDEEAEGLGYIHQLAGTCYNVSFYTWPATNSHVFAINTNLLEVWWSQSYQPEYMPVPVLWPARVELYTNVWPRFTSTLVIAGQNSDRTGLLPQTFKDARLYYQNDPSLPGYNPNEEHALLIAGQVYALRDDLNTASSSQPYVLVEYKDLERDGSPAMKVFRVVETNEVYRFAQDLTAGSLIQPPMPMTVLSRCKQTVQNEGPAWRDRKLDWWAYAAGNDGGAASTVMRFYYPVQEGFNFPALGTSGQPALGTEVPWLSREPNPSSGVPIDYVYNIVWPTEVATLLVGETLVHPKHGLPAIAGQLSVQILYQQGIAQAHGSVDINVPSNRDRYMHAEQFPNAASVMLIDSTRERSVALARLPDDIATDLQLGKLYFTLLPPHLRGRLFYDRDSGILTLRGQVIVPEAGEYYALMNRLSGADLQRVAELSANTTWKTTVASLAPDLVQITSDETPFDSLALSAGIARGVGFVTLAFNSSTNFCTPADPVSLEVIRVDVPLYRGEVKAVYSENPLDEKLTMRHSGDFSGKPEDYVFDWRYLPPDNSGMPDARPREEWLTWGGLEAGLLSVVIGGPGILTLSDNYFVCRYQPVSTNGPTGAAWSEWTDPMLAEGWIKRALNGINPFEQRIKNLLDTKVNTTVSMLSQAGARWVGNVPLNLQNINDYGLIEIYETILKRGRMLSVDSGISYGPANDALLLAAGRIHDLYMILGNEAYADAQDPTIGYGTQDRWVYGSEASASIFCFMNMVPSLLEEELSLLRGRDNSLQPSVHIYPVYNRLYWNFTKGLGGGEAAYALNYNIRNANGDSNGIINEADAKKLYPQGHGDAWGHYLTAIRGYYSLLANTNFTWIPRIESKVIGGVTVSVDYYDERKFAEAAAARARTGADIVELAHRKAYRENPEAIATEFRDSNPERAWGLAEWGSRAGQGAYYDWILAESLLPDRDPNPEHRGLQKIDRTTVPELDEILACLDTIQSKMDQADRGLSPLGLAKDVVPFDISPQEIDNGKTHFEQIYERAVVSLNNAYDMLMHAQDANQVLRRQADSQQELMEAVIAGELDYENRLIEIYGYPYSDDIGPGKLYPQGYEGPDYYHYNYIDVLDFIGEPLEVNEITVDVRLKEATFEEKNKFLENLYRAWTDDPDWELDLSSSWTTNVTFHFAKQGFMAKPASYRGHRAAEGEIQLAYRDYLKAWYELRIAVKDLQALQGAIEDTYDNIEHTANLLEDLDEMWIWSGITVTSLTFAKRVAEAVADHIEDGRELTGSFSDAMVASLPEMTIGGLAFGGDLFFGARATMKLSKSAIEGGEKVAYRIAKAVAIAAEISKVIIEGLRSTAHRRSEYDLEVRKEWLELTEKLQLQESKLTEVQKNLQNLSQTQERYRALTAKANRLLIERTQFRTRTASQVQADRYGDMAFRIFRSDALGRFQSAFDLAARYAAMAAKAYDYETCLLAQDATAVPGTDFVSQIAQSRSLGRIKDGVPLVAGGIGDPGLADALARMKANWDVLKGRLGFNNPARESSKFSLRSELFRIATPEDPVELAKSDETWRQALQACLVQDILTESDFVRYCLPFYPVRDREPALVIRFPTTIESGKNFFGRAIAGGDNAYDSSHFATKVRSVGVWFSNFDSAFGKGLANEPRVYLVPVGVDTQRSSTGNLGVTRSWQVSDQALPVPYNLGSGLLDDPDYLPLLTSLSGGFGTLRKYPSLRAYHDKGQFDASELCANSRLVGRSVWNTQWVLIIPASTLHSDVDRALEWFINGVNDDGNGVKDIRLLLQTYSYAGN